MGHKDPEQRRAYNAAYHAAHREQRRAYSAAYRAAHPEQGAAYSAAYRAANPELRIAGETVRIASLPTELRPLALAIREARQGIRSITRGNKS